MVSKDHVQNIAIVGGSGNVGSQIVKSLLQAGTFKVTAISRQESNATFADGVTVKKGDYTSSEFLESALKSQDVLIMAPAGLAPWDLQTAFIKAAAEVGVPWIIPNEFGSDGANADLSKAVPILGGKGKYRSEIEELGKSSWIGIVNNPWFDFSMKSGYFGIDIASHKATLYDDGTNPIMTTSLPQVGRGVARLLSLPVHSSTSSASLSDFKNKFFYIASFTVSQKDMLAAVQRATHTTPKDWSVTSIPVDEYINEGREKLSKGDMWEGMVQVVYGSTFKKGFGDVYHGKELSNKKVGLEMEDLDKVVEGIVKEVKA